MGGGGSGSATPTTPPGYTGGSVMDYTAPATSNFTPAAPSTGLFGLTQSQWQGIGSGIGHGAQQYGAGLASGGGAPQMAATPPLVESPIGESSVPFALIPQAGATGNEIINALNRMGVL